jgi:hypothetical protein
MSARMLLLPPSVEPGGRPLLLSVKPSVLGLVRLLAALLLRLSSWLFRDIVSSAKAGRCESLLVLPDPPRRRGGGGGGDTRLVCDERFESATTCAGANPVEFGVSVLGVGGETS